MKATKKIAAFGLAALMVVNTIFIAGPSVTSAADSSGIDLTDGLIGYYTFDNTLENSAGSGSATLHGGAGDTWNSAATGTAAYATGVNGQAYSFTGDGDTRGEGLQLDVTMPEAYTISFWVNPDTVNSATSMVFSPLDLDNGLNIADNWFGATFPTVRLWGTSVASEDVYLDNWLSSADALCGTWTYVTVTCDSNGTMVLYINGSHVGTSGTAIGGALEGMPVFLGINYWDASFDGLMDDVAIYETVLSADEVASLYANDGVPTSNAAEVVTTSHVTVHDPSIVKDTQGTSGSTYYIFGSHMAWAKSDDLIHWETFTNNINTDYATILAEPAAWAAKGSSSYDVSGNLWAPDVIWNESMQKWCMYMSVNGDNWYSSIVLLTADTLDGDWEYVGIVAQSGLVNGAVTFDYEKVMGTTTIADRYKQKSSGGNALYETNCIDPCVTYDEEGNLWMSWGSWFGGIWMIRLDGETGLRDYTYTYELSDGTSSTVTSDPYSGYRLAGGTNVSGEASYIEHIGDYYYLYVTYGGLTATGGYNMRVFRSESITGPYKDLSGDDARYAFSSRAGTINGTTGNRVMSGYQWSYMSYGFVAQGHNSAYYDSELDKTFLVYHTRFNLGTEEHQVRVHQQFVNEDGWLVTAPFEYTGETLTSNVTTDDVVGVYEVLFHKLAIDYANLEVVTGVNLSINEDGTVSGDASGTWKFGEDGAPYVTMVLDGTTYKGVFLYQQMEDSTDSTWTFTLLGTDEVNVWGYQYVGADDDLAQSAADNLTMPEGTFTDMELPSTGINTSTITWSSSNEALLSSDGTITVPDEDTVVTLTATITVGETSVTKDFDIIVYSPQTSTENKVLRTYYTDEALDLTNADSSSFQYMNPFNEATTNGVELYNGVSIKFDVTPTSGADQWLTDIIGFNAGSQGGLYFEGNSYLGYNATGGYFDANVDNTNWAWGTDFIGSSTATVEILILPTGYEVYVNNVLVYDQDDVDSGKISGSNNIDTYASVLDYLENTASYMYFGWGSWWEGGYNGTISNVVLSVLPLNAETEVSECHMYYEDFETLVGKTGSATGWTSPNASSYLSVADLDGNHYLNFANSGASGNRAAYTVFDEEAQVSGVYTVELDTALTAGVMAQRSENQLTIFGTDGNGYTTNNGVTSGYILKLSNVPPTTTTAGTNDYSQQNQWTINDSDTVITIPVGTWVHILAEVDTDAGTAAITITNNETDAVLYEGTVEINGSGTLGGLYLLNGRGIGTSAVDNIAVIQHDYVAEVVETTCTTDGYTTYTCSRCGDTYTVEGEKATGHKYEAVVTEPTCEEGGYTTYTCSVCGDTYTADETEALGHEWDYENLTWTWADDGTSATVTYSCKNDSTHSKTENADITISETTATCETAGDTTYTASVTLDGTKYTDTKKIEGAPLGHDYEVTWTWTEDYSAAAASFVCRNDSTHTGEVSATPDYKVTTAAGCETTGVGTYTATVTFNETEYTDSRTVEIPAAGHSSDGGTVTKAATCTETGTVTYTCTVCGKVLSTEEIPALGHDWQYADGSFSWTETDDGYTAVYTYKCSRCEETEDAAATVTYEVTTAAGCETTGVGTYTATVTVDGETYKDTKVVEIAALGHDYVSKVTKEATCTEEGEITYTCSNCGDSYTEAIAALGHDYVSEVTKEATCTEEGEITYTCSNCGDTYTETIAALGHSYGRPEFTWNADDTVTATVTCSVCGESDTVDAEVTTSTENNVITYTATVTVDGTTYTSTKQIILLDDEDNDLRIVIEEGISEIPDTLTEAGYDTEDKIADALTQVAVTEGYSDEDYILYDIVLQMSDDGGLTWYNVTTENFPDGGVIVTIPYPDGTNGTDYDFIVTHMFAASFDGHEPGEIEVLAVTKTDNGLTFTVTSLSPIVVSWTAVEDDSEEPGDNAGDTGEDTEDTEDTGDDTEDTGEDTEDTETVNTEDTEAVNTEASENSDSTSPKTADSALLVWMLVCAAAGLGLLGSAYAYRKKER